MKFKIKYEKIKEKYLGVRFTTKYSDSIDTYVVNIYYPEKKCYGIKSENNDNPYRQDISSKEFDTYFSNGEWIEL